MMVHIMPAARQAYKPQEKEAKVIFKYGAGHNNVAMQK